MHFMLFLILLLQNAGIGTGIHGTPVQHIPYHVIGPEPSGNSPVGF